ncbi:MAG: pseudouridine synthase [Pseudoramibacter sp.]
MITYRIPQSADGQRLDRFLTKFMPDAGKGLLMKMLRKKRIKCNGRRADPRDMITQGDVLTFYFSEETFNKFRGKSEQKPSKSQALPEVLTDLTTPPLYEDAHLLAVNKPAGLLTQPDRTGAPSVADLAARYSTGTFHAAPANRLDRGTSGVILIPKDYDTQKKLSQAIREHQTQKTYAALVFGQITEPGACDDRLIRNNNKTQIAAPAKDSKSKRAVLHYSPIKSDAHYSLLKIRLYTGKTHQIRVQLAHLGHPIVGDVKYGSADANRELKKQFGLSHPLLHAMRYSLDTPDFAFDIEAPITDPAFNRILNALQWDVKPSRKRGE